ncbi:MAG: hypothetical protein H6706_00110 [Myxococcales bacterium]|nr:hypothetical protein [Myxococcales bacterium]
MTTARAALLLTLFAALPAAGQETSSATADTLAAPASQPAPPTQPAPAAPQATPLTGRWILRLESAEVEPRKADGRRWDVSLGKLGGVIGGLVAAASGAGVAVAGGVARLGHEVGGVLDGPDLPDLGAEVRVDARRFATYVVRDTTGAAWDAAWRLDLAGDEPGVVRWTVIDKDLRNDDLVGAGSFTLRDLQAAGGVLDVSGGSVRTIRFRLTPGRP